MWALLVLGFGDASGNTLPGYYLSREACLEAVQRAVLAPGPVTGDQAMPANDGLVQFMCVPVQKGINSP